MFFRLRGIITGVFHHVLYVVLFAAVIGVTTNSYAFIQLKSIRPLMDMTDVATIQGTVSNHSSIFEWLLDKVVLNFLTGNQLEYGGNFKTASRLYSIANPNIALLGPIRLRQQRVLPVACPLSTNMGRIANFNFSAGLDFGNNYCQQSFADSLGIGNSGERRFFNGTWSSIISSSSIDVGNISTNLEPWIYRDSANLPYSGWEATYMSGGYFVDLPRRKSAAISFLKGLRSQRWLDNATTVLFVEFNLINVQTNLFIPIRVVFESLSAGGSSYDVRLYPLQLYQYNGANSLAVYVIQFLWVVVLFTQLVQIVRQIKKDGFHQFKSSGYNWLGVVQILLGLSVVGIFATRIYFIFSAVSKVQTMRTNYIGLDVLVNLEDLMFCLFGVEFFLAMVLFFRHLSVNKSWAILLAALSNGKYDLFAYSAFFGMATICFAGIGYLIMGPQCWNFSSYSRSIFALVQALIGTVDYSSLVSTHFYIFLAMFYNAIVVFLGGNVFITIILVAFKEISDNVEMATDWDSDLANFMSNSLQSLISTYFKKKRNTDVEPLGFEQRKFEADPFSNSGEAPENTADEVFWRLELLFDRMISTTQSSDAMKRKRCQIAWFMAMMDYYEAESRQRKTLEDRKNSRPTLRSENLESDIGFRNRYALDGEAIVPFYGADVTSES